MDMESVTLKLPRELLSGAQRVATARDVTIGHMVRQLLKREVDRQVNAGTPDRVDARLLAALQALLARDIALASGWGDLAERLRRHGYEMRGAGGGLVLYKSSCNTRVCKASEIGFSYVTLVERFGCAMPGHTHGSAASGVMPAGRLDPTRAARISGLLSEAKGWTDLMEQLAAEGLELRAMGARLAVHVSSTGRHLCNTAPAESLVDRFGKPMPEHLHDSFRHLPDTDGESGMRRSDLTARKQRGTDA